MLYVVAGPIGNLSDITLRAIETLKEVDLILSEDTRETDKILKYYNIHTPQISYRDQNHDRVIHKIFELLKSGQKLALVSDSGTPLISDPGYKLVNQVKEAGFDVIAVPGPSAVIAALSVSGLPTDKFAFLGFLPKKSGQRAEILKKYAELESTLVIYESPFRIKKLLQETYDLLGDRKVAVVKDLTKTYEYVILRSLSDILTHIGEIKEKGEYILLISKK